ncbi:MAG: imidazole glycerol phosphate synthase subunit HisH [Pseudomonadota bacterium]
MPNSRTAIVDYGMGNLRSVAKAVEHLGGRPLVTSDPTELARADRVIFPGVGAFGDCLAALDERGLREAVVHAARNKPFFGICLGMQLLMESSEEHGLHEGLGLLPGRVLAFPEEALAGHRGQRLKVPHMGWNEVQQVMPHPMWRGISQDARFYFVHSYYVEPASPELIAAFTPYGFSFTSAIARDNIFAVQFHPEKSQRAGLTLLGNFLAWDGRAESAGCGT